MTDAEAQVRELSQLLEGPFDPVLRDLSRLRLQTALGVLPPDGSMSFTALKRLLGLTDGALGMHLRTLTDAGFVQTEEEWTGRRRTTHYRATLAGRTALEGHLRALRAVIAAGDLAGPPRNGSS